MDAESSSADGAGADRREATPAASKADERERENTVVEIIGSLLDSDAQFIVHQTNCRHKPPGLGLAKHVFTKWPHSDVYSPRAPWTRGHQYDKPGTITVLGGGHGATAACRASRGVINLFGQDWQGKKEKSAKSWEESRGMRLEWFSQAVDAISQIPNLKSVAFPYKIGCNLAGGNWNAYRKVLEGLALKCPKVRVVVYKLPDAAEKSFKADVESDRASEREKRREGARSTGARGRSSRGRGRRRRHRKRGGQGRGAGRS